MTGIASVMGEHKLVAVSFDGERCSCGEVWPQLREHLATVALDFLVPVSITRADLARTRRTLRRLAGRQEALRRRADAIGLTGFVERSEWLIAQRTPDERLADRRRWGAALAAAGGVLSAGRAMEIALTVFDRLPAEVQASWRSSRDRFAHLGDPVEEPERRTA